jgi:hypothetical protein
MEDCASDTGQPHRQPQSPPFRPHPASNMPSGILERVDGRKDIHQACYGRRTLAEITGDGFAYLRLMRHEQAAGALQPIDAHTRVRLPFRQNSRALREQQPLRLHRLIICAGVIHKIPTYHPIRV